MFETNEGDTPRIVTSQFTGAWLSPDRGSVPVAWAVDPCVFAACLPACLQDACVYIYLNHDWNCPPLPPHTHTH
jgi:hypothetical protein